MKNSIYRRAVFFLLTAALAVLACISLQSGAQAQTSSPDDFAGQLTLTGVEGELMWLELPYMVYEHVERTDLGDIRVFDSGGLPVPFEVRKPKRLSTTPDPVALPFFPWQPDEGNSLPSSTDIQIDSTGAVIKLNNNAGAGGESATYLIDTGGLQYGASSLKLSFKNPVNDFNSPAEVRLSDDLAGWKLYDKKQTVAMFGDEQKTEHFNVEIPRKSSRYLLLSLGENAPKLAGVEAVFAPQSRPGKLRTSVFKGVKSKDGMEVVYNTEGYYPIVAIDFILPKPDAINVDVKNRMTEKAPWAFKAEGDIYRFKPDAKGNERKNSPFEIDSRAPHWLLHSTGTVTFVDAPDMEIQWEPYKLVWLARGIGPWVLAYGNHESGMVFDNNLSLLDEGTLLEASVVGEERYTPRLEETAFLDADKQQWMLWAVLILAVLVLSGFAYVVAKGMTKKK